ncbi:type II secretion system minor pseudopilin GspJ [Parendozoicomonas haliclonae]|uniref:Type II secretion system protein J n=1 Tax=Parendozoicomonas haliclonae TaxID=1960125 RepID=A0A1X7AGG6_9GAMM|nr:type II secretion system minor pseudopilin GspJ [Parendozoicomonas haliclonae]SMA39992.1 Type II secretion system protein J precursor [Parendozoicomonas haliclonae]
MNRRSRVHGFTLLEMLVAIAIFAMVGLGAYQLMAGVRDARAVTVDIQKRMQNVNLAMLVIEQDFRHIVDRGLRMDGRLTQQSLFSEDGMNGSDDEGISFTRGHWRNPEQRLPRSENQKVAYRVQGDRLERLFHYTLDPVENTEPEVQLLLEGVNGLEFRFYRNGRWQDSQDSEDILPDGVMVRMKLSGIGQIERVFSIASAWEAAL